VINPDPDFSLETRIVGELKEYFEFQKLLGPSFFPWSAKDQHLQPWSAPAPEGYDSLSSLTQAIQQCRKCPLHKARRQAVPGQGPPKTRIMIIGEGPGFEEGQQGKPFVGPAGQLLTKMLQAIQLNRDEVFITNTVKCRPPQNRQPSEDEINHCRSFWEEEIRLTDPKILVAMGNCAAQALTGSAKRISDLRGRWIDCQGRRLMATFHPAFLLRNPEAKREAWEDLKKIRREYDGLEK
jgi:uracil-DNA glycosylase family 4